MHQTAAAPTDLLDIHQVVDALYRFGAGQDLGDRALFESAFAPHAVLDFTQPARRLGVIIEPFVGRETITEIVLGTVASLDTTHTVTNPRVTLRGDHADLFALVEAQHLPKHDHRRHLLLKNVYTVQAVRDGDRWAIERMVIENVWLAGDPTVLFPAPPERPAAA